MAATQHVLRLKRTDAKSEHLLVNVTRDGSNLLDLKLIATDQDHIYHGSVKESGVKSLQATNFTGDLEQWKTTLSFALLRSPPDGPRPDFLQGVETVSSISGTTATITLRKNIDGITQRLGTVKLNQDDEKEEIHVFDWVDNAVASADDLRAQLERLQESAASQQEQLSKLTKDLDDLVKAKKEHEDDMLTKFAALLNSKKLKIRDQQRLLNGAQIDASAAEEVGKARRSGGGTCRRAGTSRAGKRKANGSVEPVEERDDEKDDGDMNDEDDAQTVATEDGDEENERIRQQTPETDEATEDEEVESSRPDQTNHAANSSQKQGGKPIETMDVDTSLPQRSKGGLPQQQPAAANTEDDDDETDDEL
ncbi:hypothetical protein M409DRAFT_24579 [Zasmidium cellare ATCC 36951]|uniref:XRCC4 coiled-coil domain-containing protein n=1 Tax=Zasmidium cellare ATCC 36951 TaxID=1080233 RepID=A0A6A6CDM0_ZASCE|nr:uncharacterized protein M409DRAFT_24579 [Zasmidium cellare ATCC 36951]KAF2165195.1 hypothetical protein M409DRAFT_24579 [Zasmidium cellare ATCC 36951]